MKKFTHLFGKDLFVGQVRIECRLNRIQDAFCLGLKKPTKQEAHEEHDAMMTVRYLHSFGLLDKRVDELLEIFNRVR